MAASALGLAILGILAIMIAGAAQLDMTSGIGLTISVLPPVGIILGTLFGLAFLVVLGIRRSRAAGDAAN